MEQAFETSVAESLENNFGTLAEKESFPQAVLSAGENLIADNIADYLMRLSIYKCYPNSLGQWM